MVDYQDLATIAEEFTMLVKVWHITNGIYIWEFFTTFYYEWEVIQGHRRYGRTIWVYSLTRMTTLLAIILIMIGFDSATPINCQVWIIFTMLFSYLAFVASSLLIVLRTIAIWNKEKIVLVIAMGIWVADIALFVNGLIRIRSVWSPKTDTCVILDIDGTKPNVVGSLVTNIVLLVIMFIGLLRLPVRLEAGGAFNLGRMLWKQGLIWILLAIIAEVPPAVLMIMDLNVPLSLMFQAPCMVLVTITTTRMYRSLVNFGSCNVHSSSHATPQGTEPAVHVHAVPIPLSRMDETVRTEQDPYPKSRMSRSGSTIGLDEQGRHKAHEVSFVDVTSM